MRLAPDPAAKVWAVPHLHDLPDDVRGKMAEVLGHEAAHRGFDSYGRPNRYWDELDAFIDALAPDEP